MNLKSATYTVPSTSRSSSRRHLSTQLFFVFQPILVAIRIVAVVHEAGVARAGQRSRGACRRLRRAVDRDARVASPGANTPEAAESAEAEPDRNDAARVHECSAFGGFLTGERKPVNCEISSTLARVAASPHIVCNGPYYRVADLNAAVGDVVCPHIAEIVD